MFYSGEFHPFRLPVTSLWIDVFQKVKALGYTGVSFYVDWALLEGTPGVFRAEGNFDLGPFFDAASEAGIYLLARPGWSIIGSTQLSADKHRSIHQCRGLRWWISGMASANIWRTENQ